MIYYAVYRLKTGRIVSYGKALRKGDISGARGEGVVYSKSPISADRHCVKGGTVQLKPVLNAEHVETSEGASFTLPDGALLPAGVEATKDGSTLHVIGRVRRRDKHVRLYHPDYRIPKLTMRQKPGKVN